MNALDGWTLHGEDAALCLQRRFDAAGWAAPLALANAVACLAERLNHHPDLIVQYGHCTVQWRTHDVGGITRLDVEAAQRVDALWRALQA